MNGISSKLPGTDTRDVLWHGTRYTIWILMIAMIMIPFLYIVSIASRPDSLVYERALIPSEFTAEAWISAWGRIAGPLQNSAIIAIGVTIVALLITVPGAYAFARTEFPGKKIGFYGILVTLMFPYVILVVPIAEIWYALGIFDTTYGLIIAYQIFVVPFAIWILRDFFEKLPSNLEEAAQVYGCTKFGAFYRVILPIATPGIIATAFLAFIVGWNDFLFSNMLTTGTGPRPAVVELFIASRGGEGTWWGQFMAMVLIIGLPPIVMYIVARQYLQQTFDLS